MCKQNPVEESLKVLKALRADLKGSVEDSVVSDLDRVISELERVSSDCPDPQHSAQRALELVGMAIEIAGLFATAYQLASCK